MTDPEIASFIRAFEDCSLPKSEWTHTRHLIMALWYLRRHRREEATRLIREGIKRYNAVQGNHTGYHETITRAWIAVIERLLSTTDRTLPDSVLAAQLLHECGDKNYLLRFYTKEPATLRGGEGPVGRPRPRPDRVDRASAFSETSHSVDHPPNPPFQGGETVVARSSLSPPCEGAGPRPKGGEVGVFFARGLRAPND